MSDQDIMILENVLESDSRMFENIEEASGFWRKLWEERGTGNKNAAWLQGVKIAIHEQVPPPTGDEWVLEVAEAVKVLSTKRNWSAPGPDKITNFCWKRASTCLLYTSPSPRD